MPDDDAPPRYKYLERRPGSTYRQWSLKGRRVRAASVWHAVNGPDHYTPEELAVDFDVPVEAIHEALDYTERNWDLIWEEHREEEEWLRAQGIPF